MEAELQGVDVREEDLEPQKGLHVAATVFRICSVIIMLLAVWQLIAWWMDPPPGGIGIGILVGDTVRLVVVAGLLWGAGDLADLLIKTHYDIRASRILAARQTYMLRQLYTESHPHATEPGGDRRSRDADGTTPEGGPAGP